MLTKLDKLSALSPKTGVATGSDASGWAHYVYTATPGIPGDSGSGLLNSAGQAKVLRYGRSITFGRLKCTSSEKGLTCRNRSHGFFLSRGSWKRI